MKTNTKVWIEQVDLTKKQNTTVELCRGEISGARPVHHTIIKGAELCFSEHVGYYHILILLEGKAVFESEGKSYELEERTTFVPSPDKRLLVRAQSDVQILEIQWDEAEGDAADLQQYQTQFPIVTPYYKAVQYVEDCKSEKTISRMLIPEETLPRFSMGSVETYGYDIVQPHEHPTLDQLFFGFSENNMNVLIDGERFHLKGNSIIHIPLGSSHGAEVTGDNHMHYIWIDFMPDKEAGVETMKSMHKLTNQTRNFAKE